MILRRLILPILFGLMTITSVIAKTTTYDTEGTDKSTEIGHRTGCTNNVLYCHCLECMDIKIGQMLLAGFKGTEPSEMIIKAIQKYHIGGVILFDADVSNNLEERNVRSPKQLRQLTKALQKVNIHDRPLFIAIDQEGGMVNRLKPQYGFPASYSAKQLGEKDDLKFTSKQMRIMARTLRKAGININFAPCVDLAINPNNPIIGGKERAFSDNVELVTKHAEVLIREMHRKGILTSLKHFPGHGSSQADTHLGLVDITNYWQEQELEPYKQLINQGYSDIVMVGHLLNYDIDTLPASLSQKTIQGIIRDRLGFKGLIATDDMNMGAIVYNYSLREALKLAINAGVEMIIVGNNGKLFEEDLVQRSHQIIRELVEQGEVPPQMIDNAYRHIIETKERLTF